jgi:hypothetical protein
VFHPILAEDLIFIELVGMFTITVTRVDVCNLIATIALVVLASLTLVKTHQVRAPVSSRVRGRGEQHVQVALHVGLRASRPTVGEPNHQRFPVHAYHHTSEPGVHGLQSPGSKLSLVNSRHFEIKRLLVRLEVTKTTATGGR